MKRYTWLAGVIAVFALTSCSDFLNETPDNRTYIDSWQKIPKLLASAYPTSTHAVICELSADNFVDNNVVVEGAHRDAYAKFHEEAYKWEDIKNYTTNEQDTPFQLWDSYYFGIATCNHAIKAMEEMSANPKEDVNLAPYWGEAHVLRAYLHFVLVNVFAESYQTDAANEKNMAVPYVTVIEDKEKVDYSTSEFRKPVKEAYALIEKDLQEGLALIDDAAYSVPAYHFNTRAANAFAARYYLYIRDYQKALEYANVALNSASLRNWSNINPNTIYSRLNSYNDEQLTCNFLITSAYSLQSRMLSACRYAINTGSKQYSVASTEDLIYGSGPCWSGIIPAFDGKCFSWGLGSQYGSWLFRVYEYFEYSDKIAGIGYVHMLYQPFTADETILTRAEAKLYLGDTQGAIADLNAWCASHSTDNELTLGRITSFYDRENSNIYCDEIHPTEMGFAQDFTAEGNETNLAILDCILHFRRIETQFEGTRWFDIKRYGIKIKHTYRGPNEDNVHKDSLNWNDPRRVLQIPDNVIQAGYPTTDRAPEVKQNSSQLMYSPVLVSRK